MELAAAPPTFSGRIIEVVSGKSLGAFLTERILAPLQMAETVFHTGEQMPAARPNPFPTDPGMARRCSSSTCGKPVMESGGGGLLSTTMDYARSRRCCSNGGSLDGTGSSAARPWS